MKLLRPSSSLVVFIVLACLVAPASAVGPTDWPQWRGADRSGQSKETGLLKTWPEGGPKLVWLYDGAGAGYSAPAIVAGKFYTMGTRGGKETLLVLDAATGKELWHVPLSEVLDNDRGDGPRGTPAVDGDRVYALTGPGVLVGVSATEKKVLWEHAMKDLGGRKPNWGFSESVLVDGDVVLCTPGGAKGAVAAFEKSTGKLRWQSAEFTDPAHYSSIVKATINGAAQYLQRTEKSVVGLAVADGKLLWQTDFHGRTAVAPTPIVKGNEVYVTAGYGAGCKLVRIEPDNQVTTVYENKVMKNHHGGVILVGEHLYGHNDNAWICQDWKTGQEVWNSRAVGKGAVGFADGMLYLLDEKSGAVVLAEASPSGWSEKGRFTPEPATKIRPARGGVWTHPVISNGKLYLRDQDMVYCYDVKAK